jgi:hypothetical protein
MPGKQPVSPQIWPRASESWDLQERSTNELDLMVFKPDGLWKSRPFKGNQIKAKRIFQIVNNAINLENRPVQASEGAMACHTNRLPKEKEAVMLHCELDSLFTTL